MHHQHNRPEDPANRAQEPPAHRVPTSATRVIDEADASHTCMHVGPYAAAYFLIARQPASASMRVFNRALFVHTQRWGSINNTSRIAFT